MSREDRRYAREAETVDGIFIKVKDTDRDPDADVDIYLDRKRIRRIDNWCVGQHVTVVGRSGQRYDVVLRDITDNTETIRVSVQSDGTQAGGGSLLPRISPNGRYVAFESDATDLVPDDTNGQRDVFVHDRGE